MGLRPIHYTYRACGPILRNAFAAAQQQMLLTLVHESSNVLGPPALILLV